MEIIRLIVAHRAPVWGLDVAGATNDSLRIKLKQRATELFYTYGRAPDVGPQQPLPHSSPSLNVQKVRRKLDELRTSAKIVKQQRQATKRHDILRFNWAALELSFCWIIRQDGLDASELLMTTGMVFFELNLEHPNQTLAEILLALSLFANPKHFAAMAQLGHLVKFSNHYKFEKQSVDIAANCFIAAANIETSCHRTSTPKYPPTLCGLADIKYRKAQHQTCSAKTRKELLSAGMAYLSQIHDTSGCHVHYLRARVCFGVDLGYEQYKALVDAALNKLSNNSNYKWAADQVIDALKRLPQTHPAQTAAAKAWAYLVP